MRDHLLIFIPQTLCNEQSGYIFGKIIYDEHSNVKKIYIIGVRKASMNLNKSTLDTIGYYSNMNHVIKESDRKHPDWIHIISQSCQNGQNNEKYQIANVILNNRNVDISRTRTIIVIYDQRALQETELFESKITLGDHFYELAKLIQSKKVMDELRIKSKSVCIKETLLAYNLTFYMYLVLLLTKITEKLLPVLKYSSLGLHVHGWLENIKWMLITIIQNKGFTLKTGNYVLAIIIDIALGIFILRLLEYYIEDTTPSQFLLNNAEVSLNI